MVVLIQYNSTEAWSQFYVCGGDVRVQLGLLSAVWCRGSIGVGVPTTDEPKTEHTKDWFRALEIGTDVFV